MRFVLPILLLVMLAVVVFREGFIFQEALLAGIFAMLVVVAVFVERGFNEVIKGLESLDRRLNRSV